MAQQIQELYPMTNEYTLPNTGYKVVMYQMDKTTFARILYNLSKEVVQIIVGNA